MSPKPESIKRAVIFECTCSDTKWGEVLRLVGSEGALGAWEAARGVQLNTTGDTYPRWRSNVIELKWDPQTAIEFKFVKCKLDGSHVVWEAGANRRLSLRDVSKQDLAVVVKCSFGKPGLQFATSSTSAPIPSFLSHESSSAPLARADSDFQFSAKWEGLATSKVAIARMTTFDESLRDSSDHNALDAFFEEAGQARSFLQKLKLIQKQSDSLAKFVVKSKDTSKEDNGKNPIKSTGEALRLLIAVYAYLNFTRTGVVPCAEDGAHFRPSQHASASAIIFENLYSMKLSFEARNSRDDELAETMALMIRGILPLLPSFAESFTCAVPLTRIRDIAHRNDIPKDLKNEIKHTIQNKLHRCAGPEDLVTTERLLKRILQNGTYPREFVSEFRIFHEELKEFFNATSLVHRLDALKGTHPESSFVTVVNDFQSRKAILSSQATVQQLVEALIHSAILRQALQKFLSQKEITLRQIESILSTDIATEQFAFTLISRLANATTENAAWGSLPLSDARWTCALQTLLCALSHVQLNTFRTQECEALINMISVVLDSRGAKPFSSFLTKPLGDVTAVITGRDQQLILNALLSRVVRLTEIYTDHVTSVAPAVVRGVGNAIHAPSVAVEIFAEAEVRASIVFQVSRLSSALLNQVAALLGYHGVEVIVHPEWKADDTTVSPVIVGTLIDLEDLWTLPTAIQSLRGARGARSGPPSVIVRLAKATGDEEVGGLRKEYGVRALMLLHPIPHLSHLSIRARQEKLPFVSIVNPQAQLISQSQALVGSEVKLTFTPEGVELAECDESAARFYRRQSSLGLMRCRSSSRASLSLRPSSPLPSTASTIDTESLPPDSIGAGDPIPVLTSADGLANLEGKAGVKAAACAKLSALSAKCGGLFTAPE